MTPHENRIEDIREQTLADAPYPRLFPSEDARLAASFLLKLADERLEALKKLRRGCWCGASRRHSPQMFHSYVCAEAKRLVDRADEEN